MPVFDTSIRTKFVDGSTDLGGKGLVTREYIMDVYPNLAPGVKTPALWLWGSNAYGQLGDGTTTSRSSPVQTIAGGTNWKQVACGGLHSVAIKTDGTLWLWGTNTSGQLGDGTTTNRSSPVQTIAGGTNWKQVACGGLHSAAIKTDGTLWLWGSGGYGQLGDGTGAGRLSPVQTIAGGTNWSQVACGLYHSAAVKTDGTLWLWGFNILGALGDNTTTSRTSPVQTITGGTNWKQVACGNYHSAAIKTDGTLWLWGYNVLGALGDGTTTSRSSPVQTIAGGTNWKQVAGGSGSSTVYGYSIAAIKTDGTLWLWGNGVYGQLGDGTGANRSSPVQTITGGNNWKQAIVVDHAAAVKADGTLWLWGRNDLGGLGDNTRTSRTSPVQTITRGINWKQVSCGQSHTAAIADGNY